MPDDSRADATAHKRTDQKVDRAAVHAHLARMIQNGGPPARNRSVSSYNDASFAHAARVYQQITNVAAQVRQVAEQGGAIRALNSHGRMALRYDIGPMRRLTTFTDDEWHLLMQQPGVAAALEK